MKQLSFLITALLFFPCLYSFGQLSITPDNTAPHPSSMLEVKATDKGMLIPRMTQAQRFAIGSPAAGLMVYQTNGTGGFYYYDGIGWTRIGENTGHHIGELFGGGVVFQLDETGKHGLVISAVDLSAAQAWSNVTNVLIGSSAQSVWNGPANSLAIVNQQNHTSSTAKLCLDYVNADYGTGVFTDWYLMSTGEARHLTNNIYQVQKALEQDANPLTIPISSGYYWSSVEASDTSAWGCGVIQCGSNASGLTGNNGSAEGIIKSEPLFVRAVRAF